MSENKADTALQIGTIEQILNAPDLEGEIFEVPEWGTSIKLKGLSKQDQLDIRRKSMVNGELDSDKSEMLTFLTGVVEPEFKLEHYTLLTQKAAGVIDRVLKRIMLLSGVTPQDIREAQSTFRD